MFRTIFVEESLVPQIEPALDGMACIGFARRRKSFGLVYRGAGEFADFHVARLVKACAGSASGFRTRRKGDSLGIFPM